MKKKSLDLALRLLKIRPRSILEIQQRLVRKKFSKNEIEKTIAVLKKEGLLDDERFAELWVESRDNTKLEGERLLRLELKRFGISEDLIEKSLDLARSDLEKIEQILQSKIKNPNDLQNPKVKLKLFGFLSRRGFDYSEIQQAVRNFGKDGDFE
jgi:regulatory protein